MYFAVNFILIMVAREPANVNCRDVLQSGRLHTKGVNRHAEVGMQEHIAFKVSGPRIVDFHDVLQRPFLDFDRIDQLEV